MKRFLIGCLLIVSLAASVFWLVRIRPIYRSFYFDAEAIKAPVAQAPLREILWQPAARIPSGETELIDEYEPRISADGSTLFFVRGKAGENADLFVAERNGVGWSEPRAIDGVNSDVDDLGPEPSADGHTLYFYSNRDGGLGGYDLWVAHRSADGWEAPTPLAPPVNSLYNDYGSALSPDGRTLYFASNRPIESDSRDLSDDASKDRWSATLREDLTVRTYDLYTAEVTDDGIQTPTPIAALNTSFNEGVPAVSAFGDFLYFASDRPGGRGGFDLYRSRRLRGEHRAPENLGDAINTPANDLDPALGMGGYRLYFSSDRPRDDAPESGERRYGLFVSTSREVFRDVEVEPRPPIAWAATWRVVGPWLLLATLALLGLLTLFALVKTFREQRVSLLTKCLLGSLLTHLALMFCFTLWHVTASIAQGIRSGGEIRISLGAGGAVDSLFAQLQGRAADASLPAGELPTLRPNAPVTRTAAPSILQTSLATLTLASLDDASTVEPTARETAPRRPASSIPHTPSPGIPEGPSVLSIHTPRSETPSAAGEPELTWISADAPTTMRPQRVFGSQHAHPAETMTPGDMSASLPSDAIVANVAQVDPVESTQRNAGAAARLARTPGAPALPASLPLSGDALRLAKVDLPRGGDEPTIESTLEVRPGHGDGLRPSAEPRTSVGANPSLESVRTPLGQATLVLDAASDSPPAGSPEGAPIAPRTHSARRPPTLDHSVATGATSISADSLRLPTSTLSSAGAAVEPLAQAPSAQGTTLRPVSSPGRTSSNPVDRHEAVTAEVAASPVAPLPAFDSAPLDGSSVTPTESVTHAGTPPPTVRSPRAELGAAALSLRTDSAVSPPTPSPVESLRSVTEAGPVLPNALNSIAGVPLGRATPAFVGVSSSPVWEQPLASRIGAVDLGALLAGTPDAPVGDRRSRSRHEPREKFTIPQSALPKPNLDLRVPTGPGGNASDERIGTVFGRVTDAESGAPLPGSVIRLDLLEAVAVTAIANDQGEYSLAVPSVPDDFALSASRLGYAPSASNVQSAAVEKGRLEVNFALRKLSEEVVVTEPAPELHHLGDDVFDGDINSQFQKSSEGNGFETRFDLSDRQIAPYVQQAEVRMLVKGVQRRHGMVINGTLLTKRLSKAPRDGGFGEFVAAIDPALLRVGENTFRILCAPPVGSDFDDFEFVNVQIHLALGVH